jgi:hypothetical protein
VSPTSGITYSNIVLKPQLELGTTATDFEQYKETTAYVLLNAPLCETDVMSRTEVVRNRASVVFDGSDDEGWGYDAGTNLFYSNALRYVMKTQSDLLCSHYGTTVGSSPYITTARGVGYTIWIYNPSYNGDISLLKSALQSSPIEVEYELATPTIEVLDTDSQIALNSLETFNGATYINVDSRVLPSEIKGEYGTSKVGAYTLKSLLNSESNALRLHELQVALVAMESEG